MKKIAICITSVLLMLLTSVLEGSESDKYVLVNPSFETESAQDGVPTGWKGQKGFYTAVTGEARTGNGCMQWRDSNTGYFLCTQETRLKAGDFAAFSVWVKSKDLKKGAPQICIEWADANGKTIGGAYNSNTQTGADGNWVKIGGLASIPEEAVKVFIVCFVSDGASGTVWFDDVELHSPESDLFSAITSDRYRNRVVAEPIRIHVGLSPFLKDRFSEVPDLTLRITGLPEQSDTDKESATRQTTLSLRPEKRTGGHFQYSLDASKLNPGRYRVVCSGVNPTTGKTEQIAMDLLRVKELPKYKSWIDSKGRLILDGKPFFPLGIYALDLVDSDSDLLAEAGFNSILPYTLPDRARLDSLYSRNIHVVYSIGNKITGWKSKNKVETIAKTLATLKDHPAIMAWYINDEIPLSRLPELIYRRKIMEETDPERPTFTVLCQVNEIQFYIPSFDIIGTDPYPVPNHPVAMTADWTKKTVDGSFGCRAVWQVPQLFNWAAHRSGLKQKKNYRAPTLKEMRAMSWMAIAEGANGLFFYSLHSLQRMDKTVAEGGQALVREPFNERWKDVSALAKEIAQWIPVLLSDGTPMAIDRASNCSPAIRIRAFGSNRETWILTVNTSDRPEKAVVTIPNGARMAESKLGPVAEANNRTVTVSLQGLESCFIRIVQ